MRRTHHANPARLAWLGVMLLLLLSWRASQPGRAERAAPILSYPDLAPTATIAPAPRRPALAVAPLAAERFDAPALERWAIRDASGAAPAGQERANWQVADGALLQDGLGAAHEPSLSETMALLGDAGWGDYTISASVYDQGNLTFGLVARSQGDSFYRYRILADTVSGTPKQVLEVVLHGVPSVLASRDGPGYAQRQWHTIALRVAGAHLSVTLDGALVAEATDATLKSGQAGLYTRALGGIRFDDVVVTPMP